MDTLFRNILTASFHGSIVIAAVILLRLVLRKTPRKYICMLWLLAGLRLLMPFQIQSSLSLQPSADPVAQVQQQISRPQIAETPEESPVQQVEIPAPAPGLVPVPVDQPVTTIITDSTGGTPVQAAAPEVSTAAEPSFWSLLPWFWFGIACCFGISSLYTYVTLKLKVREAVKIPGGWECDHIETAFILGFIRPRIYIPMGMSPEYRRYILAHERTHLDKGDHWFKMIGFVALALHWFNPLVWVAYFLLCKDIEIACDERVVQFMELEERKEYSNALLSCSTNRAHLAACPVAFGEMSVKERIKSVLSYKKPGFWISLIGVIAIVFVAVCLVTSPAKKGGAEAAGETEPTVTYNTVTVSNVDELLASIAPDTVIEIGSGSYKLSDASGYGQPSQNPYYSWAEMPDGFELNIRNVDNLTIRGSGKLATTLETDPRSAGVLHFVNSSNVTLEDFTAGHTIALGECSSGVIYLQDSSAVEMHRLGVYGCGMVGLELLNCSDIAMHDSDIYDCSNMAARIDGSKNITISDSRIYRIGSEEYGGYVYFDINYTEDVTVENCEISDSTVMNFVQMTAGTLQLTNNLFAGNRVQERAFNLTGGYVGELSDQDLPVKLVLDGNRFENNSVRRWFSSGIVVDKAGSPITEEQMQVAYSPKTDIPSRAQARLEVHVSTVDELITAIAPNTRIVLDAALYDLSTATGYGTASGTYYYWEDTLVDGPSLIIRDVDNLVIESNDGNVDSHTIVAVPRYADVLTFKGCSNVTLSGFTAGHTAGEPGSCSGGVLEFRDSDGLTVDNCGLFGCGILGVDAEYCTDIQVVNCDIYECSQGGVVFRDSKKILMENNTLRDLQGTDMSFYGCEDVTVDGETLIPVGTTDSVIRQSEEQAGVQELDNLVTGFAYAYFYADTQTMKNYLSAGFTGEPEAYPTGDNELIVCWYEVTLDMYREAVANGHYQFAYPYRKKPSSNIQNLTIDVVRENDTWKVSSYSLEA